MLPSDSCVLSVYAGYLKYNHRQKQEARMYCLFFAVIDQVIGISASASILGYSIYTVSDRTAEFVSPYLWVTIPFVAYGVFRYLFIVYSMGLGGSPDRVLLKDTPLKVNIILWVGTVVAVLVTNPAM